MPKSTYFVNYCNRGTADAVGATVVVDFDSLLAVNSASVPYTNIGNKYTFQIGNILEDACGQFTITTTLNCDAVLGTTHCVTAHIYPDTICTPIDPRWDRANVSVDGRCLGDSVLFRIRNIGSGNMSQIKKYIVIEDNVLRIMPINFQLNAGQEILIKRPANGTTQRLYAEQVDYFPYPSNPTAVVENCGGLNPGFVTQFPNNDGADFIAINCTQNRNSFDPNDKEGTPTGFDNQHYIAKKTDINYKIRFQNTGTDTAYDIYILDTISNKLDVSKLQMGASSHPYSYEIYGEGVAVLKVIFRNINLVDSFHNEPLSHGFFTYSIAQDTLNKANDKIYNHADIYFDANHPVKTNTTLHTVTDSYFRIISSVIENKIKAATNAYPNPFNDKCTIEIKSDNKQNTTYQFKLYNLNGALIQTQTVTNKVELFAADLPAAIYLYRIEHDGELVAAGKIVKE
ncbi:MAG: T9SS type A sorting domain-containing protein [Saprospirales bacterium]|nr:T9SS type A sorting domain-containing protein [Saprospirales bacterium]